MGEDSMRIWRSLFSPLWLAVLVAFFLLVLLTVPVSFAAETDTAAPPTVGLDDVGAGSLLLRTPAPGRFVPAPLIGTQADIRIGGMVARVTLRQQFLNPSKHWLEALYAFPLPENAAVNRMRLEAGGTVIEARIRERGEARRVYDQARREGRRAALVEQHRPNLFTNSVATIAPGETVTIELHYQQTVRYADGRFELRFPMVVAPRYTPRGPALVRADPQGWVTGDPALPQAPPPEFPVLRPEDGKLNPVALTIRLDAEMKLADLASPYHRITAEGWEDGAAEITLADGPIPADRDFVLRWTPQTGSAPVAGLFRETVGDAAYLLAMVLPPAQDDLPAPPRDVVFVLDRSGSMAGTSIVQARASFADALSRLRPADRFEVIRFSNVTERMFGGMRRATEQAISRAVAAVNRTRADGGTEMLPALQAALSGRTETGRLRQVVFLTDGAVGNEDALLTEIETRAGATRLFTIGIGSAPNSYFMTAAARAGRGSFTHIGALDEVAARTGELFARLERPAMIDLSAAWALGPSGAGIDAYPKRMPDLYHGEPLVLVARMSAADADDATAKLHLGGNRGGQRWRHALPLTGARETAGIGAIWGRSRIEALMGTLRRGADQQAVRKAVIETALRFDLVSRFTSLVAVQEQAVRPPGVPLASTRAPLNLPAGWEYDKVFGDAAAPPPAMLHRAAGSAALAPQAAKMRVMMPQGATGWEKQAMIGLTLLILALALVLGCRRCG